MKRLRLIFVALLCANVLFGQFPTFDSYTVSGVSSVSFRGRKSGIHSKFKTEVPPWILAAGTQKSYFFVDGSDTYIWSSLIPLTVNWTINFRKQAEGPVIASRSYINSADFDAARPTQHWKRIYNAIYSANTIHHPAAGQVSIGFLHGENKNYVVGPIQSRYAKRYNNTIQPNVPINFADPLTWSGGKPYQEGWNAYNAFVSAAWTPVAPQTNGGKCYFNNEMGPIVWPATGYVTRNGVKCTSGLKHPSSIVFDNYIYVFYSEGGAFGDNIPQEEGRQEGIKVARAPLSDALNPGSYEVYYKNKLGMETWNRSLPEGFTKEKLLDFVAVRGAKSTDIMNDKVAQAQHIRFAVAKVRNTNYFMGVEEYIDIADGRKFKVAIRFSKDLVKWSDRALMVSEAASWETSRLNYPVFMNKEGNSNTEIDLEDFYILGTEPGVKNFVNKIRIKAPASTFRSVRTVQFPPYVILPNPNNGQFKLAYALDTVSSVAINLYNFTGRQVGMHKAQQTPPGKYVHEFDIRNLPCGMYLVAVLVNDRRYVYKVMKAQ